MKKQTLLKKIAKLGLEVDDNGTRCYIVHNGKIASWFYQNDYHSGEPYALNFHIKSVGQESDPYTDYYPGYHLDNATQMLQTLVPPPAKFPVGSLVRGKQNKRAQRSGYAGKVGLVTEAGGSNYCRVEWVGEAKNNPYNNYPERDLELVSAA